MESESILGPILLCFIFLGIPLLYFVFKMKKVSETGQISDFVEANVSKVRKYAQRTVSNSYLTGCSWVLTNETNDFVLYTFRSNKDLLITTNGLVKIYKYELIVDNNSILVTKDDITEHYEIQNIRDDFFFLNKLSDQSILIFANQTKYKDQLKAAICKETKLYKRFN